MTIQLSSTFKPTLTILAPDETDSNHLIVKLATWKGNAQVQVANEPGKRLKIGFVQVLYDNLIEVTYAGSITEITTGPPPICDSPKALWVPWYWRLKLYAPVVDNVVAATQVIAKMGDGPTHRVPWTSPTDGSPLQRVSYRLKFKTWLVVRDLSNGKPYPQQFTNVLYQFNTNIKHQFNVDPGKPVGQRCLLATSREDHALLESVSPPTHIPDCVWSNKVANDSVAHAEKVRTVKSATSPVAPIISSVNVQAAVQKTPPIMTMAPPPKARQPAPQPKKSGGWFKKLFHFADLPDLPDDE